MSTASTGSTPDGTQENPYTDIKEAFVAVETLSADDSEKQDYVISLSEGVYALNETVEINAFNNYKNVASVTLEGNGNTSVKSGSSVKKSELVKVTDTDIINRVPDKAKDNLYSVNIGSSIENLEVTADGAIMQKAKYPNDGYLKTKNSNGTAFECAYAEGWQTAEDMYIYYMPSYMSYAYQAKANGTTITATTQKTFEDDKEFYVYNLLEELDSNGEYFYDKTSGNLYIYGNTASEYEIFYGNSGLLNVSAFTNLTIKDITFENATDTLVVLNNCEDTILKNCVFRNGSKNAVRISGGQNTGMLNCEVYDMGEGGISLSGGNRQSLVPGNNYVNNCSVHDCQRLDRSYTALISMNGVGNSVINSDIYNSYHTAITIYGNDLLIKDNKIYNVCTETSDMGAVYAEGDWTMRGTQIIHNYFENVPAKGQLGAFAIYLDNGLSGITVQNNIFKNIARQAVYVNGGRDNNVTNNIFVNTGSLGALSDILNWGDGTVNEAMLTKLNAVEYNSGTYAKYQNLANILDDEPVIPKYNKFTNNVLVNTKDLSTGWLRKTNISELVSEYGCEFTVFECDYSDLTNYAEDDYTLKTETAKALGFEEFSNSFGRQ